MRFCLPLDCCCLLGLSAPFPGPGGSASRSCAKAPFSAALGAFAWGDAAGTDGRPWRGGITPRCRLRGVRRREATCRAMPGAMLAGRGGDPRRWPRAREDASSQQCRVIQPCWYQATAIKGREIRLGWRWMSSCMEMSRDRVSQRRARRGRRPKQRRGSAGVLPGRAAGRTSPARPLSLALVFCPRPLTALGPAARGSSVAETSPALCQLLHPPASLSALGKFHGLKKKIKEKREKKMNLIIHKVFIFNSALQNVSM